MINILSTKILKPIILLTLLSLNLAALAVNNESFVFIENGNKLKLELNLAKGHKTYWLDTTDSAISTNIDFRNSKNVKNCLLIWPFPKYDKFSKTFYYEDILSIEIYPEAENKNLPIILSVEINYLICAEHMCVPVAQNIEKTFAARQCDQKLIFKRFNISDVLVTNKDIIFSANFEDKVIAPKFAVNQFSYGVIEAINVTKINDYKFNVSCLLKENKFKKINGKTFEIYSNKTQLPVDLVIKESLSTSDIIIAVVSGIIGGLILNFMPCVLPILSLKILSLTKSPVSRLAISANILGIVCCFLILAMLAIFFKNSGQNFGLGVHFQYPEFIIFLAITLIFYISLSQDRLHLNLPATLNNILINLNFKSRLFENFSNGMIAVFMSTPCTAPYVGTAMVFALAHNNYMILAIFLSISLGFSLPYFALLIWPRRFTNSFKHPKILKHTKALLSIMLILTLLWLVNILHSQLGFRPVAGFVGLLVILKFIIENQAETPNKIIMKFTLVFLIILACFTLPKITYNQIIETQITNEGIWQSFEPNKIQKYLSAKKIVIVDITADWCVTCKYNNFIAWENPKVKLLLAKENIIAMRGDYTSRDNYIYSFLRDNDSAGIPFGKIYSNKYPKGLNLPILLSPSKILNLLKTVMND